jgi:hypothetical protein
MQRLALLAALAFTFGSAAAVAAQENAVEFSTFTGLPLAGMVIDNVPGGDARFHEQLALPDPCMAPVVFVGGPAQAGFPNGRWFAVSGF